MPTRILLLRHAESANPLIFHGAESDVGLSERGRRQAEAIALVLATEAPEVLISSAMRRARETALPIARACGLPVRIEPDLHERCVGALSGIPTQLREGEWPDTLRRWMAGETAFAPAGAESFDDIRRRVLPVWQRVTSEGEGKTIVLVAHGVVCKVLLFTLLAEYSVADWHRVGPIHNASINELVLEEDGWGAVRLNEVPATVASV
jgi:broad specificity phosphatase PhoE